MIHTIIRDLDEEEMKTLIKCLGNWIYFQRRQRGVTGEIRSLFCVYDEPACSILRWAHLFNKIL